MNQEEELQIDDVHHGPNKTKSQRAIQKQTAQLDMSDSLETRWISGTHGDETGCSTSRSGESFLSGFHTLGLWELMEGVSGFGLGNGMEGGEGGKTCDVVGQVLRSGIHDDGWMDGWWW